MIGLIAIATQYLKKKNLMNYKNILGSFNNINNSVEEVNSWNKLKEKLEKRLKVN